MIKKFFSAALILCTTSMVWAMDPTSNQGEEALNPSLGSSHFNRNSRLEGSTLDLTAFWTLPADAYDDPLVKPHVKTYTGPIGPMTFSPEVMTAVLRKLFHPDD